MSAFHSSTQPDPDNMADSWEVRRSAYHEDPISMWRGDRSEWVVVPPRDDHSDSAPSSAPGSPQIPESDSNLTGSVHSSDFQLSQRSDAATSEVGTDDDLVDLEPEGTDAEEDAQARKGNNSPQLRVSKQSDGTGSAGLTLTSWQDPDASTSSIRTLQYASGYVPPRTSLQVGGTRSNSESASQVIEAQPPQYELKFPVLEASGLSSSDPSLLHLSKDTLKETGSDNTQSDSQTPLIATADRSEPAYRSPARGQSFLSDIGNATRKRDAGIAVNATQPTAVNQASQARLNGVPAARQIDQAWLESLARAGQECKLASPSVLPSDILSTDLGSLPSSPGFRALSDNGSAWTVDSQAGIEKMLQSFAEQGTGAGMLDAAVADPKNGGQAARQPGIARRLAIFALPLLALGLLASLGGSNNGLLFENAHSMVAEHARSTFGASSAASVQIAFKALTVAPARIDVAVYSSATEVQPASCTPVKNTAIAVEPVINTDIQDAGLTTSLSTTPGAEEKTLAVKSNSHPLAFMQATLATATSGFQGRRRQRSPVTAEAGPYERLDILPAQVPSERLPTDCLTSASHNASLSPHAPNAWVSVLPSYPGVNIAAIATHLASAWQQLVDWPKRFAHSLLGPRYLNAEHEILEELLARTRRIKQPLAERFRQARHSSPGTNGPGSALSTQTEIAHRLLHQTQAELQLALHRLETQYAALRAQSDVVLAAAQGASRRTIDQARKGLDNILREAADAVERTTGVEVPLPKRIVRKKHQDSTFGEKVMQVFHHAAIAIV